MNLKTTIAAAALLAATAFTPANAGQEHQIIQACLAAIGHDPGPADGVFGKRTRAAIRGWQASKGFDQSGYIEPGQVEEILTDCIEAEPPKPSPKPADASGSACDRLDALSAEWYNRSCQNFEEAKNLRFLCRQELGDCDGKEIFTTQGSHVGIPGCVYTMRDC